MRIGVRVCGTGLSLLMVAACLADGPATRATAPAGTKPELKSPLAPVDPQPLRLATPAATRTHLVRIRSFDRDETYELMTEDDYVALRDRIRREVSLHRKAIDIAREAWKADEAASGPFPSGAAGSRSVSLVGTFKDPVDAQEKLDGYRVRKEEEKADEAAREEERLKRKHTRVSWNLDRLEHRERVDKQAIKDEQTAEQTRLQREALARQLYESALNRLLDSTPASKP